jgi:4-amino-4-deoxy-L-arabinose transferase-like glycosyltransferase
VDRVDAVIAGSPLRASPADRCPADRPSKSSPATRLRPKWLLGMLVAALVVRCVGFTQPLVGPFATKHCVYAMAARNWAEGRAPWWRPTLDCLSDGERAWHLMEWPASAFVAGMGQRLCGGNLDFWGRAVSIACSLAAVGFAYLLARRRLGETAARAASLLVAFAPVAVVYGRGFMLEPSLVACSFAAVLGFDVWLRDGRRGALIGAALAVAIAVLTKIYMLLLFVPLAALLIETSASRRTWRIAAIVFAVALLPAACWYAQVASVSATAGPAVDFHPLSRAAVQTVPHPLLTTPAYYFAVVRDLATITLTPLGLLLAAVGACDARFRPQWPWLLATAALLVLLPLKFLHANYYFLVLLPPLALAAGLGWQRLVERFAPARPTQFALAAIGLLIAARYTVGPAYRIPVEDRDVTAAGLQVQHLTTADEPVVTLHGSTLDLLYYCDRTGWALDVDDPALLQGIESSRQHGARRLVIVGEATAARNTALTAWRRGRTPEASGSDWAVYRLDREESVARRSP